MYIYIYGYLCENFEHNIENVHAYPQYILPAIM